MDADPRPARVALVTGAAGGLGSAVARAVSSGVETVVCVDRDEGGLDEVVAGQPNCVPMVADLSQWRACEDVVSETVRQFGRVDVLVNAAAILMRSQPVDVGPDLFSTVFDTNTRSVFVLMTRAIQDMELRGWGRIVNVTSVGVHTGGYSLTSAVYEASKAAVGNFTRTFARYGAPRGILVNAVAPGGIRTPMLTRDTPADVLSAVMADIPLGRLAEPEEIASMVAYLASDANAYCSGATVDVNGGTVMP